MGLRLGVVGGGCSGLSYEMEFSETRTNDNILDFGGFAVLLDPKSAIYLKDVTLDFEDGLKGKGFVFKNPNATNTCGCGESLQRLRHSTSTARSPNSRAGHSLKSRGATANVFSRAR